MLGHQRLIFSLSFRIMITGSTSGLIETIKDAVSIHSIKKAEYAKRLAEGRLGHVTLFDHFISVSELPLAFMHLISPR
jgi:hypothetical protein